MKEFVKSDDRRSGLVKWLAKVVKEKAFRTLVAAVVLVALAIAYPWKIHAALFEGKLDDDVKKGLLAIVAVAFGLSLSR